jgi:hypothetical protein
MSYTRQYLDTKGSEDSFGRTIWALGYLLAHVPMDAYYESAKAIFLRAVPNFNKLESARGIANTIIGLSYYLHSFPSDIGMTNLLGELVEKLLVQYDSHREEGWKWFEDEMTYDNAILPLSLLHAQTILNDDRVNTTAMESMHFLSDLTLRKGHLSVIGNESWYRKGETPAAFAQQPLDVMMTVLMFRKAWQVTGDRGYLENLCKSYMWFQGDNDLRISLYDEETKGCCDGLEHYGINRNQGAESTLAYLIAHLVTLQTVEEMNNVPGAKPKNGNSLTITQQKATAI